MIFEMTGAGHVLDAAQDVRLDGLLLPRDQGTGRRRE
jgi:hypothetical protein